MAHVGAPQSRKKIFGFFAVFCRGVYTTHGDSHSNLEFTYSSSHTGSGLWRLVQLNTRSLHPAPLCIPPTWLSARRTVPVFSRRRLSKPSNCSLFHVLHHTQHGLYSVPPSRGPAQSSTAQHAGPDASPSKMRPRFERVARGLHLLPAAASSCHAPAVAWDGSVPRGSCPVRRGLPPRPVRRRLHACASAAG
jgi:hypothetical protein